jgi:hypothetical protein
MCSVIKDSSRIGRPCCRQHLLPCRTDGQGLRLRLLSR